MLFSLVLGWANLLLLRHTKQIFALRECLSRVHLWNSGAAIKNWRKSRLTPDWLALVFNPGEAGTPLTKEFVLRTFGTANWTQFCPGSDTRKAADRGSGDEVEFFCRLKWTWAGSLTSTYRVVRKYNFKS